MKEFLKTIKAMWTNTAYKLYFTQARQKAKFPYIVWSVVDAPRSRKFTEQHNEILIRFNVYSNKSVGAANECLTILELIESTYNEQDLSVTGFEANCALLLLSQNIVRDTIKEPNSWIGTMLFGITLIRDVS